MKRRAMVAARVVFAVLGLAAALRSTVAGRQNSKEQFTGFAINMNRGPKTAVVDFTITRWSTDEERAQLIAILKEFEDPTHRLLRAVQKLPSVGYIRTQKSLGWELHYARQSPLEDGGRRIVLATDRPIGFWEARNQPRSIEYPFTVIEMHLDKNDRGSGKILAGTRIYIDSKTNNLVLENYGQQPVRFNEIKRLK